MSFSGLILTNIGRNELARAEMGETFSITDVILGDGKYNESITNIKEMVNPVMTLPVTKMERQNGSEVILECDFNSLDVPKAFYWREIGIIANGKLCYYDNSREDAEYIDPQSDKLIKQKRMRFILLISSDIEVSVSVPSTLYALDEDMQKVLYPVYEEPEELEEPESGESIFKLLGKLKGYVNQLISHTANKDNPHDITKDKIGLGKVDNTADVDKPVSTAQQSALDELYQQMIAYTCQKIAELIDGAPTSLDTLKEVADAIAANKTIMDALDAAIGQKASAAEFDSHEKDAIKHITAAERTKWNAKMNVDGDASNVTTTFSQASTRANLTSKEKLSVSMGKIMKWFADLAGGAASTLLGNNLTANRAVVSNASGKLAVSGVTATELGYLIGTKEKIQTQIDELNTDLTAKASTVELNTEKNTRAQVDASLQNQINDAKAVNSFAFGTIISNVAEFSNGYLLEKDGVVYFSFEFKISNIANAVTTNIASIPYKPYGICHCSATLYNDNSSFAVFTSVNDGIIQIHLPSNCVLNANRLNNRLRFSGSFPYKK